MDAWLISEQGEKTPLRGSCSIGRHRDNAVVLAGEQISRRHALLHRQTDGRYWLLDFGSANGTRLNGRPVTAPVQLQAEDRIEIAGHFLTFRQTAYQRSSTDEDSTAVDANLKTRQAAGAFAATGHGLLVLDGDGRLQNSSASAIAWLEKFFPEHRSANAVPAQVAAWVAKHSPKVRSGKAPEAFVVEKDGCRLRLAADVDSSGRLLLLLTLEEMVFSIPVLQRAGLTAREAEVLHWIAEGKSNPEIAIILGISNRTVTTHVESIFAKLGVNNRATALLCVVEKLRGS